MPPLDKFRKIRRDVLQTINDLRHKAAEKAPDTIPLEHDEFGNAAADAYAEQLLGPLKMEPNDNMMQQFCEQFGLVNPNKDAVAIIGFSYLEDDMESPDKTRAAEFMDAHGLLLELQHEMNLLKDAKFTHVGIGLAMDSTKVLIVEILTKKTIAIDRLQPTETGGVLVQGRVFDDKVGLYAARICLRDNVKKVFGEAAPEHMFVEEITGSKVKNYEIRFKQQIADEVFYAAENIVLEIFMRTAQVNKIKYGAAAQANEKIKFQDLRLDMRQPLELKPDPRIEIENQHDREVYDIENRERLQREEEERVMRIAA